MQRQHRRCWMAVALHYLASVSAALDHSLGEAQSSATRTLRGRTGTGPATITALLQHASESQARLGALAREVYQLRRDVTHVSGLVAQSGLRINLALQKLHNADAKLDANHASAGILEHLASDMEYRMADLNASADEASRRIPNETEVVRTLEALAADNVTARVATLESKLDSLSEGSTAVGRIAALQGEVGAYQSAVFNLVNRTISEPFGTFVSASRLAIGNLRNATLNIHEEIQQPC
mmetsp:Transcript_60979/g.132237  ORF Transcript_60979/g.132237 Transcript_60979/m.132237 type:complete len:239 (+) Transcript_60979:64-780(+)